MDGVVCAEYSGYLQFRAAAMEALNEKTEMPNQSKRKWLVLDAQAGEQYAVNVRAMFLFNFIHWHFVWVDNFINVGFGCWERHAYGSQ